MAFVYATRMSPMLIWRMWFRKSGRRYITQFAELVMDEEYEREPAPVMAPPRPARNHTNMDYDSDEFYDAEEEIVSADECEQELPPEFYNRIEEEEEEDETDSDDTSESSNEDSQATEESDQQQGPVEVNGVVVHNHLDAYEDNMAQLYEIPARLLLNGMRLDNGYVLPPVEEEAANNGAAGGEPRLGNDPLNEQIAVVVPEPGENVMDLRLAGRRQALLQELRRDGFVRGADPNDDLRARRRFNALGGEAADAAFDDILDAEDAIDEEDDLLFAEARGRAPLLEPDDLLLPVDFAGDEQPDDMLGLPRQYWVRREQLMCSQNLNVLHKSRRLAEQFQLHNRNTRPNNFSFVLTGMSRRLHQKIYAACIALNANVQSQVDATTTHVVMGSFGRKRPANVDPFAEATPPPNPRCQYLPHLRTMNALVGAAYGVPVVITEWIKISFSQGEWAPVTPYIVGHLADLVQKAQEKRRSLIDLGLPPRCFDIFQQRRVRLMTSAGRMYSPTHYLLTMCGAELCDENSEADNGRQPRALRVGTHHGEIAPNWVFDSVVASYILDHDNYIIHRVHRA